MNIWIDVGHTPQFNFYKNFISLLGANGHHVFLTVLNRGKTPLIVQKEVGDWPFVSIYVIGIHKMNKWSVIWDANIKRFFQLINWARGKKIDIGFSNGYLCAAVCKMKHINNYAFGDDPQTFDYRLKIWFCTHSYYCLYKEPTSMRISSKVTVLPVLKEWAYLNPRDYKPNLDALAPFGVKPYQYLFLREVSVGTINYSGQKANSIMQIAQDIPQDLPVLFSLEEKKNQAMYPQNWILLQEPLPDIRSLIYYSCGLVSSGDSMAREASLLGVPSYYLGTRCDMPANLAASEIAHLQNGNTIGIKDWINFIIAHKNSTAQSQSEIRQHINERFVDINNFMYGFVEQHPISK